MAASRLGRFVWIGLVPAAFTAVVLGGLVVATHEGRSCGGRAAMVERGQASRVERASEAPAQAQGQQRLALAVWGGERGEQVRWSAQVGEGACQAQEGRCAFARPGQLAVVIPEQVRPQDAKALVALAGLVGSAPAGVGVDIIHYASREGALPLRATQATDVAELMLCAQLQAPEDYQACVDALAPRLERLERLPRTAGARFWQVTTQQGPHHRSLERLLQALQPRPGTAVALLGEWPQQEVLRAAMEVDQRAHLTVVTESARGEEGEASVGGMYRYAQRTMASLALLPQGEVDAGLLQAVVWRRFDQRGVGARACGISGMERPRMQRQWYKRYLRALLMWYGVGTLVMVSLWAGHRARKQRLAEAAARGQRS